MSMRTDFVADEAAMLEYGIAMSKVMAHDELVFLEGELGAGKTTLARGILRGLGFSGLHSPVRSDFRRTAGAFSTRCLHYRFDQRERHLAAGQRGDASITRAPSLPAASD